MRLTLINILRIHDTLYIYIEREREFCKLGMSVGTYKLQAEWRTSWGFRAQASQAHPSIVTSQAQAKETQGFVIHNDHLQTCTPTYV